MNCDVVWDFVVPIDFLLFPDLLDDDFRSCHERGDESQWVKDRCGGFRDESLCPASWSVLSVLLVLVDPFSDVPELSCEGEAIVFLHRVSHAENFSGLVDDVVVVRECDLFG